MTRAGVFARKELRDLGRHRIVWILGATLALAVVIAVVVASLAFRAQMADYQAYVADLASSGSAVTAAAPQLFPLQLLRGGLEYVEIIGALFAIVVGYGTIAREAARGTLPLIYTRSHGPRALVIGKLLGIAAFWAALVTVLVLVAGVTVALVGGSGLTVADAFRLAIAAAAAWVYLMFWSAVAVGLTATMRRPGTALILALGLWLAIVLIVPQIGDTMDPDNQVPGGLFKALAIAKPDELAVLAHFSHYEVTRNGLEVTSISKLFERISFGFLGIKDKYNQQSLGFVWADMYRYTWAMLALLTAGLGFAVSVTTRTRLLRKTA
ncbi:ABC transporter permease subunit [Demequina sp.]|uniref:ABC transporter permease n=1 Tax=Demequina sp. TaxID=2050685 RepID=UPI0025F1E78B|nr:ABC transporter permease subunit [Demequina sp.]